MPDESEIYVNKWLVAVTVLTGTLMSAINTSSVNATLPYIQGTIAASTTEITWVVTSYLLANVIFNFIALLTVIQEPQKTIYGKTK